MRRHSLDGCLIVSDALFFATKTLSLNPTSSNLPPLDTSIHLNLRSYGETNFFASLLFTDYYT